MHHELFFQEDGHVEEQQEQTFLTKQRFVYGAFMQLYASCPHGTPAEGVGPTGVRFGIPVAGQSCSVVKHLSELQQQKSLILLSQS